MRKITLLLLALLVLNNLKAQDFSRMKGSEACAHGKQHMHELVPETAVAHAFDVLNYTIDKDLYHCYTAPYPKDFYASVVVSFRVDSVMSSLNLHASNSSLQILSVSGNGSSFTQEDDQLTIQLDRTYEPGDTASVTIHYYHYNQPDNAFYTGNGFVFTDCEPQGARKWFPCFDEPVDKATLTLRAKVPANVKLGSNGRLADSVAVADTIWYTWVSRDPIATYLMVISSRVNYKLDIVNWVSALYPNDTTPIRFYYNPTENPSSMKTMIIPLADYMESLFGKHPFEKNGFATLNNQFSWGGMENQTLTSLCPGCWYSSIVTHEFAHQWFGDMITCATWADLFLNEGFATYIETLWTGNVNGYDAYLSENESNASYYLSANPGWPISDPEWATNVPNNNILFDYAVTYCKSACVLYMYRHMVGDSLFFKSLYDYANDSALRYQSATIANFVDRMNQSTGMDLNWFFDQWIFTPDHPDYLVTYDFFENGASGWEVKANIKQTQTSTGFFRMPVDLWVQFSDASDTVFTVMNEFNDQNYSFAVSKQPVNFAFDPDNRIILKTKAVIMSAGNQPAQEEWSVKILSNPSNGILSVKIEATAKKSTDITVYTLEGRAVYTAKGIELNSGVNYKQIDLTALPAGTYMLTMRTEGSTATEKFILQ